MGRWLFKPWLIITCCLVRGKEGGGRRKGNTQDGLLGIRASATGWKVGRNRGLNPILSFQNFYVIIQPQGATYSLTQLLQVQFKLLPDRIVSEFEVPAFSGMTDSPDSKCDWPGRRPHHTPNLRFRCTPPVTPQSTMLGCLDSLRGLRQSSTRSGYAGPGSRTGCPP